jgi:hypothetical protein
MVFEKRKRGRSMGLLANRFWNTIMQNCDGESFETEGHGLYTLKEERGAAA